MGYSFAQLEQLWTNAGGSPSLAPTMAAVALAESGGNPNALNDNPSTGDYSVGLWQINYFGNLAPSRTQSYGSPQQLLADPQAQARAAVALAGNGGGLGNWSTYSSGAYQKYLAGGGSSSSSSSASDASLSTGSISWWDPLTWGSGVDAIGNFLKAISWIVQPTSWLRIIAGILGVGFLGAGIFAYVQAV